MKTKCKRYLVYPPNLFLHLAMIWQKRFPPLNFWGKKAHLPTHRQYFCKDGFECTLSATLMSYEIKSL